MYYTRISKEQRHTIEIMLNNNDSMQKIARSMGRNVGTISREVERNTGLNGYCHEEAHAMSVNRTNAKNVYKKLDAPITSSILKALLNKHSPEQIAGYCDERSIPMLGKSSIYNFIREDKNQGGSLHKNLRYGNKKHRRRYGKTDKRGIIPNRVSIHQRPKEVESRTTVGHWESDTVLGARHRGALVTLVERTTGVAKIAFVEKKTKELVTQAIIELLSPLKDHVHSITYDNGLEFAGHTEVMKELGCQSYFADPYSSWQRGTNENTNGLIRQWFPKKQPINKENTAQLPEVMKSLNDRPRKRHKYLSPKEVFETKTGAKLC